MAAHILNIMNDTVENYYSLTNEQRQDRVQKLSYALSYASGCDLLDLDDWNILRELTRSKSEDNLYAIWIFWRKVQDFYISEHDKYGCPENTEEWVRRKYAKMMQEKE